MPYSQINRVVRRSMELKMKRILSGIQPTGNLTIGNYLGALRNWVALQDDFDACYMIANLHATTVRQDPTDLRKRTVAAVALLLACGIDPEKSIVFVQSHVPEHTMLTWALSCNTYIGELSRMTQFKDKASRHQDNVNAGLFTYPVLMAADILLYQADLVPVGADQKQHLELARDIADRFNKSFGDSFVIPEPYISKIGAKIMSLQEPDKKMSKSDPNPNASVLILDDPDTITRKIRRAVTDCDGRITPNPEKAGVYNLLSIYAACCNTTPEQAADRFSESGYGTLKDAVSEALVETLSPVQKEYVRILADKEYLRSVMEKGAEKASGIARKTIRKVYHKMGYDA